MKKVSAIILSLLLAAAIAACGNTASTKDSAATEATKADNVDVQAQLQEIMRDEKYNGVIRVSKDGVVLCEAANGKMSRNSDEPITVDSKFAVGSVSKQFTAACIMLLKEEGRLSVDDTIDKWYPDYEYGKDITIKNLLTMRSGIRDFVNEPDSEQEILERYDYGVDATEESIRSATREWILSKELSFEPDAQYTYSNSNYFLLAEIVEQETGERFASFLRERFFTPLEMDDTGTAEEPSSFEGLVPTYDEEEYTQITTPGFCFGDGGIITTAADMDKWMTSLREHTILSEDSIKEMTTDYSPESEHYGYGLVIENGTWSHGGHVDSYLTQMFTVPEEEYDLFAVTNKSDSIKMENVISQIKTLTR